MNSKKWEVLGRMKSKNLNIGTQEIHNILLENRDLRTKKEQEEFLNPKNPKEITLKDVGIKTSEVKKAITRILKAKKNKEKVIIYGDYDADGVCATAIVWETLYSIGVDALPHLPDRFNEGYGLNIETLKKLKKETPGLGLIITVDHGIVAGEKIIFAKKLGIDIILTDHHQPGNVLPKPYSLIHTTKVGGAAVAWFFARELIKSLKLDQKEIEEKLELAAIGTIADQLPLISINRSIVKFGLQRLRKTERLGLKALFETANLESGDLGTYEVGFIIAPRINAMGRLEHAIDALRLVCTKDKLKARDLSLHLNKVNFERQKVVEEVVLHAKNEMKDKFLEKVIILAHESYHEGVIGLAAARLVEVFYRPAIVFSKKGEIAKASARSISGFNIIEAIRLQTKYLLEGGGHPMAAGFSIKSKDIEKFKLSFQTSVEKLITDDVIARKLKIDMEIEFVNISNDLLSIIKSFEPTGLGNPAPTFVTRNVQIVEKRIIGKEGKHLKLKLKNSKRTLDAIAFGFGESDLKLDENSYINVAYNVEENVWNGNKNLQLKIKDIKENKN